MCGISGFLPREDFRERSYVEVTVRKMVSTMRHRGPDGSGLYCEPSRETLIGLGHNRLAIIDLTPDGEQPMSNEDDSLWIVFNGEIYNFPELKEELIRRGHEFRSKTDTEVILHGYEEYGPAIINRLKGMFAFALWDRRTKTLLLARDRTGQKPLYYTTADHRGLFFASEIKALMAANAVQPIINQQAFQEYFTFQNILSDQTLLADVRLLPAGHYLIVRQEKMELVRYWQPDASIDPALGEGDVIDRIREIMPLAVRRHLLSDVEIGSYLSGGMDSGTIVALASQQLPVLYTFTAGFDTVGVTGREADFDERTVAELTAASCNTDHHVRFIHAGNIPPVLARLMWHLEEPRVGMCYQNYLIAQVAGRVVKVVLSGAGGDELFAGYPWRYKYAEGAVDHKSFCAKYLGFWNRLIPLDEQCNFFAAEWACDMDYAYPVKVMERVIEPLPFHDPIEMALRFELLTFLHGLLVVEDKVSMAHSLEVRVPFLDNDLIDFALTVPWHLKLRNGDGKYVLRQALQGFLPPQITGLKKRGFSAPEGNWYRGPLRGLMEEIILSDRSLSRGLFRPEALQKTVEHFLGGTSDSDARLLIWSLISFETWCRIFLDGEHPKEDHLAAGQQPVSVESSRRLARYPLVHRS